MESIYTEDLLKKFISEIEGADGEAAVRARAYTDALAAPPGSLGKLYEAAWKLAGITGRVKNEVRNRRIIVLCADNGVVVEGVSSAPQSVTVSQAVNMTKRLTGMSCLARHFGVDVQVVDMGIKADYDCPEIVDRRIARGTGNIYREPAMTRDMAVRAILDGIYLAKQAKDEGVDVIGVGEMGIGNTTTSSAVLAALTGCGAEEVTGRGGGITDESFSKKKAVIDHALKELKPDREDVPDVLSKVGGFDLAAMCGVFLGAARYRLPAVIDGFISVVAALCACRLNPRCSDFMFPSHVSVEKGYMMAVNEIGLSPWLDLNMRLGEGSGCPLAFQILEASCALMNEMASFDGAGIDDEYLTDIRKQDF